MKFFILFFVVLFVSCSTQKETPAILPIIPKPNQVLTGQGSFKPGENISLSVGSKELLPVAELFIRQMKEVFPMTLSEEEKSGIRIELTEISDNDPSYSLRVSKKGILIKSSSLQGAFYGLQSLRQLFLFAGKDNGDVRLPVVTIEDSPRFGWRGLMLDESRHFFGAEKVKQLLDVMALHKLNVFHWHLVDASGWRIEIKKYPNLTVVGGIGNHSDPTAPAAFYTQEEIAEIVDYAKERFISIIPEIDMPGHAAAANRAYPEFSGGGSERYPEFTFNPGKEGTYQYLTDILREISAMFPAEYIHLGGDEVHFGNESWNTDADVRRLMKEHNLPDLKAVESYFVTRMADSIDMLDKIVVGWDEIVDHNLNPEKSLVMWWRHNLPEKLNSALSKNYDVVLCPRIPLYFDFVQDEQHKAGRKWSGAFSPLNLVYTFPPDTLPGFLTHQQQVKGLQANLWTEQIKDNSRLDFMTHPRLSALSEAAWTNSESKNYDDFTKRIKPMLIYFKNQNIGFYDPGAPESTPEQDKVQSPEQNK
jgi:hexosaminidase